MSEAPRIDLVYTWVDDTQPGFTQAQQQHARDAHDLNPNRTRDNLDLLRYSMRSIEAFAPWLGNVYLLTCRPQVPRWLDTTHPRLRLVHHDEVIAPRHLPTFNSFAIISHLHLLPGLSPTFLYMEDDMLLGAPVTPADFVEPDGRIRVFRRIEATPAPALRDDASTSPWNRSLAQVNHRLDERYGPQRRRHVNHVPLWIEARHWQAMLDLWPDATELTRASRFRATGNIAPEYLYPHYLLAEGAGRVQTLAHTYARTMYLPLENSVLLAGALTALARWRRPRMLTLNDNFGDRPNPRVVQRMRAFLDGYFPEPSSFERKASA